MPEEFEHELIGVLQEHYGENFDYNRKKPWTH